MKRRHFNPYVKAVQYLGGVLTERMLPGARHIPAQFITASEIIDPGRNAH